MNLCPVRDICQLRTDQTHTNRLRYINLNTDRYRLPDEKAQRVHFGFVQDIFLHRIRTDQVPTSVRKQTLKLFETKTQTSRGANGHETINVDLAICWRPLKTSYRSFFHHLLKVPYLSEGA